VKGEGSQFKEFLCIRTSQTGAGAIDSPSGIVVQRSDRIDPCLDCFSCFVEVVGFVEDGSLNATTTVMAHDQDMADLEFRHTVRDDGDGIKISGAVLIRDVAFGEEDTRGRSENGSFGNPGVARSAIGSCP
jgi:hypothetical protein